MNSQTDFLRMNGRTFGPPLVFLLLIAGALEAAVALNLVNPLLLPAPHQMLAALFEDPSMFVRGLGETVLATTLGFVLASGLGFGVALALSLFPLVRRAVLPFAIFFQTVPIIAVAPLLVIYFGFGLPTVTVASASVALFPVLANTLMGLELTDPGQLELLRVLGATRRQVLWHLRLEAAYPSIYGGLKIAAGLSVVGTVAGEFVAGGGLGAIIDSARTQQRTDLVFAALLLLSLVGLGLVGILKLLHLALNAHRPYGITLKENGHV